MKVVPGGTSAGKTFGILPILLDRAARTPNLEISVVSESIPHLRKGALKDFLKILHETKRAEFVEYNKTLLTANFPNGSYIEFFSADQEGKVRGPRRHILYVNECNNISFETYHQLAIRTSQEIWLDFNPSNEFWVHTELRDDPDVEELVLTYKDNEALPESIVNEIEKAKIKAFINPESNDLFSELNIKSNYWSNWWKVYGLGQVGSLEGVIFSNWTIVKNIPEKAKLIGYGLDFGYTNDPTAVVAVWQCDGKYYLDEIIYETGLQNSDIVQKIRENGIKDNVRGVADSAEPKSIDYIRKKGLNIIPVDKGRDSVNYGIDIMQDIPIMHVTTSSTNVIKELRNYTWDKDKTGKTLNQPIDAFNHAIDAIRYFFMMNSKPSQEFFIV